MKVGKGKGKTIYGTGIEINLSSKELVDAIITYLKINDIYIIGARTITINNELCKPCKIYIDPSGLLIKDSKKYSGRTGEVEDDLVNQLL